MLHKCIIGLLLVVICLEMMMIAMMMVLCARVSVLKTSSAVFLISVQIQAFHDLGYDEKVLSTRLSRKLMPKKMDEGYPDQDLVFYTDQKKDLFAGDQVVKREEEVMVINGAEGSYPNDLDTMDYSHVRRRGPIHNNSSSESNNLP